MKATILIDNETNGSLACEWGLSILIEHQGHLTLLDSGASPLFAKNATDLGINLSQVSAAALSHAHYDHSDGFDEFFSRNATAKLYVMQSVRENCYDYKDGDLYYIGIAPGMIARNEDRIERVSEPTEIAPCVWAVPHTTPGLKRKGEAAHMCTGPDMNDAIKNPSLQAGETSGIPVIHSIEDSLVPDNFAHEQSIVVKLDDGIAVFNSCSHCGADVVLAEAKAFMPDQPVRLLVGGFHLYLTPDHEVRALASRLKQAGVERIYTGHCTGERARSILQEELGKETVRPTASGVVIRID